MKEHVRLEHLEDATCIRLNRPEAYNAFDLEMVQSLAETLIRIARDPGIPAVIITGSGKAFCTGGDLRWVHSCGENRGAAFHELAARYHQATLEVRGMAKPVFAAINGTAAGGGFSLALACDFRVMDETAVLRQGYTSNGLSIDGGGTFTLPRLVGLARALEIAAFDRPISAEQALQWGLVTEVTPPGECEKRALALAAELKQRASSSFAASKRLLNQSFQTPLEAQLEQERDCLAWCGDQPEGREGVAAFLEKRRPDYALKRKSDIR